MRRLREAASKREEYEYNRDGTALVHQTAKKELAVVIAPLVVTSEDMRIFPPATIEELKEKLLSIGTSFPAACEVAMELAVANDSTDLDLDHFITRLGLDPDGTEERVKYRRILWEALKLLAQTSLVGTISGRYRDKRGNPLTYLEQAPVLVITRTVYDEHDKSTDGTVEKTKTPLRVIFGAGGFFAQNRGNQKVLSSFGDTRQLAAIAPGKPSGQWAQTLILALNQHWREHAAYCEITHVGEDSHETVIIEKTTRRKLFELVRPEPNPFKTLYGNTPGRAREYWDAAIQRLREEKIALIVGVSTTTLPPRGWQIPWLDEPIDIRPHPENRTAIENLKEIASGSKSWNKKKGRRKKTDSNEASQ